MLLKWYDLDVYTSSRDVTGWPNAEKRILQCDCYYYSKWILHILHVPESISRFQILFQPFLWKIRILEGIQSTIGIKWPHAWAHAHIKNRNASRSWHETKCAFNPMGKGPPETSPRSCTRNSHSTQASHGFLRIVDLPLQVLIFNWSPVDHALDVVIDYAPTAYDPWLRRLRLSHFVKISGKQRTWWFSSVLAPLQRPVFFL